MNICMVLKLSKIVDWIIDLFFVVCGGIVILLVIQVFCLTSFKVPSDSMEPVLQPGDKIIVNKLIYGARLFNLFASLKGKDIKIYRVPGWGMLKRNDVIVFNFPYAENRWDSIRFNVMQYYVKRCIALPGDTLEIRNCYYKVRGYNGELGNMKAQNYLSSLERPEEKGIVVGTFPWDWRLRWNIREFGPLPIPKKGQEIRMESRTLHMYKQLIEWEQKCKLIEHNDRIYIGDSLIHIYKFEKNYYFVSGDKMANSRDSRYWGMLPEDYIVGKVTRIWNSKDVNTGKIRWHRVMKKIN